MMPPPDGAGMVQLSLLNMADKKSYETALEKVLPRVRSVSVFPLGQLKGNQLVDSHQHLGGEGGARGKEGGREGGGRKKEGKGG